MMNVFIYRNYNELDGIRKKCTFHYYQLAYPYKDKSYDSTQLTKTPMEWQNNG